MEVIVRAIPRSYDFATAPLTSQMHATSDCAGPGMGGVNWYQTRPSLETFGFEFTYHNVDLTELRNQMQRTRNRGVTHDSQSEIDMHYSTPLL